MSPVRPICERTCSMGQCREAGRCQHPDNLSESRPAAPKLIGWRTPDYLWETTESDQARNWAKTVGALPIFEGDPNTKLTVPSTLALVAVGVDLFEPARGAALPMIPDSWRFGFWEQNGELRFGSRDSGPFVAWDAVAPLIGPRASVAEAMALADRYALAFHPKYQWGGVENNRLCEEARKALFVALTGAAA